MHTPVPAHEISTQKGAIVVGAVLSAIGVLGFVPGITTHYGQLAFVGHDSGARLFGLFTVSVVHNLAHLAFGITGLVLASTFDGARRFLLGAGIAYLALFAYGLAVDHDTSVDLTAVNDADDWLHLGLAAGLIALGIGLSRPRRNDGHRSVVPDGP
jgi:hypothetical protein